MSRKPRTPEGSVNYPLVHKGPLPKRKFRLGDVPLARSAFSLLPRRPKRARRSGPWRISVPTGRIQTSALARAPRRREQDVEEILGVVPNDQYLGVPSEPHYRPPGT